MISEEIRKIIKEDIIAGINSVLSEEVKQFTTDYSSMDKMTSILEDLGLVSDDDLDQNGWDADYWQTFRKGEVKYQLSGSGYYGGNSFYKTN